jgi:hypothetical protein
MRSTPMRYTPTRRMLMRYHRKAICVRSTPHANSPSPELALEFAPLIRSEGQLSKKSIVVSPVAASLHASLTLEPVKSMQPFCFATFNSPRRAQGSFVIAKETNLDPLRQSWLSKLYPLLHNFHWLLDCPCPLSSIFNAHGFQGSFTFSIVL